MNIMKSMDNLTINKNGAQARTVACHRAGSVSRTVKLMTIMVNHQGYDTFEHVKQIRTTELVSSTCSTQSSDYTSQHKLFCFNQLITYHCKECQ